MNQFIARAIEEHKKCISYLSDNQGVIEEIASRIIAALRKGNKVFFFGNGGSASDAQHLAAELVGRFKKDRTPLAAVALSANTSILTAVGNDYGFEEIFAQQIKALAKPGDVAFALSTSGNSENVTRAVSAAKEKGLITAAFLGNDGGKLKSLVDIAFIVGARDTARIQEIHILAGHVICEIIEHELFK